mmetsp:Transcript_3417/g.9725  ORF Transcript_3417/g.9725 Transcript_3417/m.9725 type:complete len:195 (+) Transcript_3417:360-944(+)
MTTTNTPKPTDNGSNADNTNASDIDDTNTTSEAALENSRSHSSAAVRPQRQESALRHASSTGDDGGHDGKNSNEPADRLMHGDGAFDHHAISALSSPFSLPSIASSFFVWPSRGGISESGLPYGGNNTWATTNGGSNRDHAVAAAVATEIVVLDEGSPSRHAHAPRGASLLEIIDDVLETLDGMEDDEEEFCQH